MAALKVKPALRELTNSITESRYKVLLNVFKTIRSTKVAIPLVSSFLTGIPMIYGLGITAGLISVEAFLELYFNSKKIKASNGLSFLLGMKRK